MYRRDVADGMGGEHSPQPALSLIAQVTSYRQFAVSDVATLAEQQINDREGPAFESRSRKAGPRPA